MAKIGHQMEFPNFSDRRIDDIEDPTADDHYKSFSRAADSEDVVLMKVYAEALKEKFPEHSWPEFLVGWALMEQKKPGLARQHFFRAISLGEKFRRRIDYCYEKMQALGLSNPWEDIVEWSWHLNSSKQAEIRAQEGVEAASEKLAHR